MTEDEFKRKVVFEAVPKDDVYEVTVAIAKKGFLAQGDEPMDLADRLASELYGEITAGHKAVRVSAPVGEGCEVALVSDAMERLYEAAELVGANARSFNGKELVCDISVSFR